MDPQEFLLYAASFTDTWKYFLLFAGVIVEGPILMVASGFLLHSGLVEPIPLFIVIVLGDLVGDILWYAVGFYFAEPRLRKKGHFFGITMAKYEKIKLLFDKYHEKILFISKITLGFGLALGTLIVAGATKVPFRKYMIVNFLGEVVLVIVLLTLGFLFGQLYDIIQDEFKILSLIGAGGLVIFLGHGFIHYLRERIKA